MDRYLTGRKVKCPRRESHRSVSFPTGLVTLSLSFGVNKCFGNNLESLNSTTDRIISKFTMTLSLNVYPD